MPEKKKKLEEYYCEKCRKTMKSKNFYSSNNLEKYPDTFLHQCKNCITMFVDNWNPETYLWILEECDVPYIPDKWHDLLRRYGTNPAEVTGTTILGRYLSAVKIKPWGDYRWKDTEYLQEMQDEKTRAAMAQRGYSAQEIDKVIREGGKIDIPEKPAFSEDDGLSAPVDYFGQQSETDEIESDLTEEDKTMLRLKWGKTYRPEEWVMLEQLYQEMLISYDVQSAGDINTLKLACKTSLKSNQLLDIGDVDGAQKMIKMYDGLMKSGKWTAAQNKADSSDEIDSIGEIVAICEKEGFIPRYYIDSPKDKVDRVIQDMQIYNRNLVMEELGLGNMIEIALKNIQDEQEKIKEAGEYAEEHGANADDDLFDYDTPIITTEDFQDYQEFEENWDQEADKVFDEIENGEEG